MYTLLCDYSVMFRYARHLPNKYAALLRMYNDLLLGHATFHGTFDPPSRDDAMFRPVKF